MTNKTTSPALNLIFLFIILSLLSCDPVCTRLCESFYYDLSEWSLSDDTISKDIIFVNQTSEEFIFEHIETRYSEPYEYSDLCGPEGLECRLGKTIFYSNNLLNLKLGFEYLQYELEDLSQNDICYRFNIKDETLDTFVQTRRICFELENFLDEIDTIDQIGIDELKYENVLKYEVDVMLNSSDNNIYPTNLVKELYFKPPIGLIQIELENGQILTRKK